MARETRCTREADSTTRPREWERRTSGAPRCLDRRAVRRHDRSILSPSGGWVKHQAEMLESEERRLGRTADEPRVAVRTGSPLLEDTEMHHPRRHWTEICQPETSEPVPGPAVQPTIWGLADDESASGDQERAPAFRRHCGGTERPGDHRVERLS